MDPEQDLPGSIYRVPDKIWGFEAVGRVEHPGACMVVDQAQGKAVFLRGTGSTRCHRSPNITVEPDEHNGLKKRTYFELAPRCLSLRSMVLIHYDRRLGSLTREEHIKALHELQRLFPFQEED